MKPHIRPLSLCHPLFKAVMNERTSARNEWNASLSYSSWAEHVEFWPILVNELVQYSIVIGSCVWKQTNNARKYISHFQSTSWLQVYYYLLRFAIISDQTKEILIEVLSGANINYKDSRTMKPNNWKEIVLAMKEKLVFLTKTSRSRRRWFYILFCT